MALSPNYGWAEPDNSSLVKNGAQDIRALGDAIDTSVWNIGYGQAGKNKIINGDFGIWQRGTTFTNQATNAYTSDRWMVTSINSTVDVARSSFTAGAAPVAGYESQFFASVTADATDSDCRFQQRIEDVRTFAGQTITVSFYAKSSITTDALRFVRIQQNFGTTGSPSAVVNNDSSAVTLSSSWTRYSFTFNIASVSGKTITDNSFFAIIFCLKASTAQTLDLWGVQVEAGSVATPFQTATGTIQGELAACQRYYWRYLSTGVVRMSLGYATSADAAVSTIPYPVQMRTAPNGLEQSGTATDYNIHTAAGAQVCSAVPTFLTATNNAGTVTLTATGLLTAGQGLGVRSVNTNAFFGWSAEL
jgi:hypothetical protein